MHSKIVFSLLTLGLILWIPFLSTSQEPAPETFRWMTDLAEARAKALQEGRPLLIVFR